jgi:hypothetical protein
METKQEVTKKFIIGVVLIILSLVMGKVILIPILIFPGSKAWWTTSLIIYSASWVIVVIGVLLAGIEGYRLATHKYKEYQRRTVHKVREHGKKAVYHGKRAAKKTVRHGKKAAKKTVRVLKRPVHHGKRAARKTVRVLKKPLRARKYR